MKRLMLICLLVTGLTMVSRAQNTAGVKTADEKAKGLKKQLNLTDAQTRKISMIYEQSSKQFDKIKASEHGDNDKMLTAIRPLRKNTITKIKAVLTPKQVIKYDKLVNDPHSSNSNGWGDGWSTATAQ